MTRLRLRQGTPEVLYELESNIMAYHATTQQYAALEAFLNTLPLLNQEAFNHIGLYLMQQYRRLGQKANARRAYQTLLLYSSTDPDMVSIAAYFDVVGNLQQLPAGQRPAPADSVQLVRLARSSAAYAGVACQTLHYYYPHISCGSSSPATLRQGALPTVVAAFEEAFPNPAGSSTRFRFEVYKPAQALALALYDLKTGQCVRQLPLPNTARGEVEVTVADLPNGFYACKLLVDGQAVATRKLAVAH